MFEAEEIVVLPDLYEPEEAVIFAPSGFTACIRKRGYGGLSPAHLLRSVDRASAEKVPNPLKERIRQVVANIMIFSLPDALFDEIQQAVTDENLLVSEVMDKATVFATVKLKGSGESRLHGKLALGLGGHVNESDLGNFPLTAELVLDHLVKYAGIREVQEEVTAEGEQGHVLGSILSKGIIPLGIINSSASEVESVHMGFLSIVAVPESLQLRIRETEQLVAAPISLNEFNRPHALEDRYIVDHWSQLVLQVPRNHMAGLIIASATDSTASVKHMRSLLLDLAAQRAKSGDAT